MSPLTLSIVQALGLIAAAKAFVLARAYVEARAHQLPFNVTSFVKARAHELRQRDVHGATWVSRSAGPVALGLAAVMLLAAPLSTEVGALEVFANPVTTGVFAGALVSVVALWNYDVDRHEARFAHGLVVAALLFGVFSLGAVMSASLWPAVVSTFLAAYTVSREGNTRATGHSALLVRGAFLAVAIAIGMTAFFPLNHLLPVMHPVLLFAVRGAAVIGIMLGLDWVCLKLKIVRSEDLLGLAALIAIVGLVLAVALPVV